jgi:hypothetical protein
VEGVVDLPLCREVKVVDARADYMCYFKWSELLWS